MIDMLGKPVVLGDHVVDDRGKVYLIEKTEPSYQKEGLAKCREIKKRSLGQLTYVHLQHVFVVGNYPITEHQNWTKSNQQLWKILYDQFIASKVKESIRQRRKEFQERGKK